MYQQTRPENPAKTFLKRYRALIVEQESLQRSIEAAYDRARSCSVRLKPIHVTGGSGAYDRMAEDVARIADETEQLKATKTRVAAALSEILEAIGAVEDETQHAVLLLRYVEGLDWLKIADKLNYADRTIFILHGRALWAVNHWLQAKEKSPG